MGRLRRSHPHAWVLSRDTGIRRDYGRNPYDGYDDPRTDPFLFKGTPDPRLPAKARIVGIQDGNDSVAVVTDELRKARVLALPLAGRPVVVWLKPGTASALDGAGVAEGREVGATGVFEARLDGRELLFEAAGESFRDRESGSTWDVFGQATSGPLAGRSLVPIVHVDTFWFAWAAFRRDTRMFPPAPGPNRGEVVVTFQMLNGASGSILAFWCKEPESGLLRGSDHSFGGPG